MRIGIFGGTFDPIHHGHLIMASLVLEEYDLDKLVFMPAGNPVLKEGASPFEVRLDMVKLAIEGQDKMGYTRIEDRDRVSYTYHTIRDLKDGAKEDHKYFLIMGADSFESIDKWYKYQDLLREIEIIVVDRHGSGDLKEIKNRYKDFALGINILEGPIIEISSTQIRQRSKEARSIRYLTTERVCYYIERQGIYTRD